MAGLVLVVALLSQMEGNPLPALPSGQAPSAQAPDALAPQPPGAAGESPMPSGSPPVAAPTEPDAAPPPPPSPPPPPLTQWEPLHREVEMMAEGSLRVCELAVLPATVLPGVGDAVGTAAQWVCIVPAALFVDYVALHHGSVISHFWQALLGLILKKGFDTIVDVPILVLSLAVAIGALAGGAALAWFGAPITLTIAGVLSVGVLTWLGLRSVRDWIGDRLFEGTYFLFARKAEPAEIAEAQKHAWLKPGLAGLPAGWALISTVAGTKERFTWLHVIPVAGQLLKAGARAEDLKMRVRRTAREDLQIEKPELYAMDNAIEGLTATEGVSRAVGELCMIIGGGLFAGGVVAAAFGDRPAAEWLGGGGLLAGGVGGAALLVGSTAKALEPVIIPAAWALAPMPGEE